MDMDDPALAVQKYAEVQQCLDVHKSLPWQVSIDMMKLAWVQLATPETQQFLDDYLFKVISLMISQNPAKLGQFERSVMEDSIVITINMLIKLLPTKHNHLATLARILDQKSTYYAGMKVGYTMTPGYAFVRVQAARRFADNNGFGILLDIFRDETFVWPGGEMVMTFLKALNIAEVLVNTDEDVKAGLLQAIQHKLLALPDEQLKRENTEILNQISAALQWICKHLALNGQPQHMATLRAFFFDFTLKLMSSGSLVLRLHAWEQLNEIIIEAKLTRPMASNYVVSGAGTDFVNGVYSLVAKNLAHGEAPSYIKPPSGNAPLLTLFRCDMRTKVKWWFISHADAIKPGTDMDKDYYLHKSGHGDEREPPMRGWSRMNTNAPLHGADPAPTVTRGDVVLAKGTTRESYFDHQLLTLCQKHNLIGTIFGPSIHREIVSRSGRLLLFLAEYDSLKVEHLQLIWKAAITNTEVDIVDEVFAVLVLISPSISDELFGALIDLATEAMHQPEHFLKVAQFLEKFSVDHFKPIANINSSVAALKLLGLVWELYRDSQFETLKNAPVLRELLTNCLDQRDGPRVVTAWVRDCTSQLATYASSSGATCEDAASRVVRSLFFLVSKHTTAAMVEKLEPAELTDCLVGEIDRFLASNRSKFDSGAMDMSVYVSQLSNRLEILRKFYSTSAALTLSMETLRRISQLLSGSSVEQGIFFEFLRCCSKGVVSMADALNAFTEFVCHESIDWSTCSDAAFECFKTYFCELEGCFTEFPPGTELPPRRGLDTLWRIALNINSSSATANAIDLLLQAYDTILFVENSAYPDMLAIIFHHIEGVLSTASIKEDGGSFSSRSLQTISRCISILTAALAKSKGQADVAHAVRGTLHRMSITVYYRRVQSYYNSVTRLDTVRLEKGSEGSVHLEVHPLHTVKDLKDRIIEHADLGSVKITLDHPNKELIPNCTRLSELGLSDGGEIYASYQSAFSAKSYEDDLYSDSSMAVGTTKITHVGQLIAGDCAKFDALLTLCEMCNDPALSESIWRLIMLIPTQIDLMQQAVDQICFPDGSGNVSSDWNKILLDSSETRTAYMLQIIDHVLQPAAELMSPSMIARSLQFRDAFVQTDGFATVLNILISTPTTDSIVNSTTLSVALHIVHYMLFESELAQRSLDSTMDPDGVDASIDRSMGSINREWSEPSVALLEKVEEHSAQVIEKLLYVARSAAASQASQVVHNALMVITKLIKSPEAASELTNNPQSEVLLTTVLRSDSKKVRQMAAEFAEKVGRTQPVVFGWLLSQLASMQPSDRNCAETFSALTTLLASVHTTRTESGRALPPDNCAELARILSDKLTTYPRKRTPVVDDEHDVLLGYLEILNALIDIEPQAVKNTLLGKTLVQRFVSEFLFAMPTADQDATSVCDTPGTRQAAFNVLSSYLTVTMEGFETVLSELSSLSKQAARHMHNNWGLQVSHDIKKPDMKFSGLKNQGCTCYMNSLLQVLFMSTAFREAVLATPLREIHRTALWHLSDVEIVGQRFLFEYYNKSWREGLVIGYDPISARHRVQYSKPDGSSDEIAFFNIHEGRFQRETGRVRIIPSEDEEPMSEREEAAYGVLDQLQRTFCFMKLSKKRFFDPLPFVEACKSLNLNFNVYHQNDSAEFCDQLLDRIETATKGKHTQKDMWADIFLKNVFGGRWLYQKIPQDCEVYNTKKEGCGHWQSSRLETFLKVELMIRGKEKVEDSLEELMQGELMDGDNKINCEVCTQKKATVRRTCFGDLPNTMILHLKRFDLDFQTFETVKLNNRMAFPQRINMMKYTKEGIEAEERRRQAEQEAAAGGEAGAEGSTVGLQYEEEGTPLDPSDYEYELQGVLVHAGVAQGGHYYSYIRDGATADEWYKFEDDEVTVFHADQIPTHCFGGPPSASGAAGGGSNNLMEEDRTANALMLLYNRVKVPETTANPVVASPEKETSMGSPSNVGKPTNTPVDADADAAADAKVVSSKAGVLVDGMQAYQREVQESNMAHILTCYLLDPDLHAFVRGMLNSITLTTKKNPSKPYPVDGVDAIAQEVELLNMVKWSPSQSPDDLPLRTVQFNVTFLLDVILHCRERGSIRTYIQVLKDAFEAYPHTASWFLNHVVDNTTCPWFTEYVLQSTDPLSRGSFVQVLVSAVTVVAPKEPTALLQFKVIKTPDLKKELAQSGDSTVACALLLRLILDHTLKSVNYVRTADELFVLMRDLAAIPCISEFLLNIGMISFLCYFVMPEHAAQGTRTLFERYLRPGTRVDYNLLLQSVFEAIAALLGVPQIRKVPLLTEHSFVVDPELVPDARDALVTIFEESSRAGGMDNHDIMRYLERVTSFTNQKVTATQVRHILDRNHTLSDGRLSLEGFLSYYIDLAQQSPNVAWRDLNAFGFRNNLTRISNNTPTTAAVAVTASVEPTSAHSSDADAGTRPVVAVPVPMAFGGSGDTTHLPLRSMLISENCRLCLSELTFYEVGMTANEEAARAIVKRVCYGDLDVSATLLQQALSKYLAISRENNWNTNSPAPAIVEFLNVVLSVDDGLLPQRLYEILMHPKLGLAVIACNERVRPSHIRANDYDSNQLFTRYITAVQSLVGTPRVLDEFKNIAEAEPKVKLVLGNLRISGRHRLTVNEEQVVSNVIVRLQHAGVPEVNGDYLFQSIRHDAGFYARKGTFRGQEATYTLYKCSLKNGGYQWFISITPQGSEPGTADDIDFYYGHAKAHDKLPTMHWLKMNPDPHHFSREPAPVVTLIQLNDQSNGDNNSNEPDETAEVVGDSSDSDRDGFVGVGDYGVEESYNTYRSGDYYE